MVKQIPVFKEKIFIAIGFIWSFYTGVRRNSEDGGGVQDNTNNGLK